MKSCKVNAVMIEEMDQVNCKNTSNVEEREKHRGIENATHIGWYRA
jgi:hypothetical protein